MIDPTDATKQDLFGTRECSGQEIDQVDITFDSGHNYPVREQSRSG